MSFRLTKNKTLFYYLHCVKTYLIFIYICAYVYRTILHYSQTYIKILHSIYFKFINQYKWIKHVSEFVCLYSKWYLTPTHFLLQML